MLSTSQLESNRERERDCANFKKKTVNDFYCDGFGHSLVISTLTLLKGKTRRNEQKKQRPLHLEPNWIEKKKKFTYVLLTKVYRIYLLPFCVCVRFHRCTDACVILSCCWQALESEFHIKKRRCFDIDREHWANSTSQHNVKPLH